ncbi:MAG TPA: bifunctional biotin--[acetyl-CoA-carboxylase] ligase/biotin operon repressor BirA [Methylophilaceae bacterium]
MNVHTFPTLRLLADGEFHSGEALGTQLGISRAAVWNAIQQAQELGIVIHSVHGKGYRLSSAIDFLDSARITKALKSAAKNFNLELLETTASTNSDLMKRAAENAPQGTCIAVELQQAGRGRRGRTWVSSLGSGLTFSLLWRFSQGAVALGGLSLAVGVALVRALDEVGVTQLALKWPNDVLHADKKLAGTLIELQGEMLGPTAAVIGIGLNIKLPDEIKANIDQQVADLADTSAPPRNELLAVLLQHLYDVLTEFEQQGFAMLREEWQKHHAYQGKPVQLTLPNGSAVNGIVNGIDADGALLVEVGGQVQRFSTAEISLRSRA